MNPILKTLKARSNSTEDESPAPSVVSSHGSGAASTIIERPHYEDYFSSSSTTKPPWMSADDSTAMFFGEPQYLKKERARTRLEDWLWESRGNEVQGKVNNPYLELYPDTYNTDNNKKRNLIVFDMSKTDQIISKSSVLNNKNRPSTPFPSEWDFDERALEAIRHGNNKKEPSVEKDDEYFRSMRCKTPPSIAFKNFLDQVIQSSNVAVVEKEDLIKIPSVPNLHEMPCELSARSTRTFWLEKLVGYHKIVGEKAEEATEKHNFETDLIGTNVNSGPLSDDEEDPTVEVEDEECDTGARLFDRAFLSVIEDIAEEEEEEEAKSSEGSNSSGYFGSNNEETRTPTPTITTPTITTPTTTTIKEGLNEGR